VYWRHHIYAELCQHWLWTNSKTNRVLLTKLWFTDIEIIVLVIWGKERDEKGEGMKKEGVRGGWGNIFPQYTFSHSTLNSFCMLIIWSIAWFLSKLLALCVQILFLQLCYFVFAMTRWSRRHQPQKCRERNSYSTADAGQSQGIMCHWSCRYCLHSFILVTTTNSLALNWNQDFGVVS